MSMAGAHARGTWSFLTSGPCTSFYVQKLRKLLLCTTYCMGTSLHCRYLFTWNIDAKRRIFFFFSGYLPIKGFPTRLNYFIDNLGPIEIIKNRARHNLIDAKCRWRSDWLDGAVGFREPLGQTKVMQICQGETLNYQGAITHEVCV